MKLWIIRFKGLIQWFMQLEPQIHGHWCIRPVSKDCPSKGYRWDCSGLLCGHLEHKNCPVCTAEREAQP
jgi:hypothetical protein